MLEKEKKHCRSLLRDFPDDIIFSLAETVTKKKISLTSVKDAIDAIVSYSVTATELLSRKKVQKDLLFKYLSKEGIFMGPNSTKDEMIEKILKHWSSDMPKPLTVALKDKGRISSSAASVSKPTTNVTYNFTHVEYHNVFYENTEQRNTKININNASQQNAQAPGHAQAQASPISSNYNAPQASGHTLAQTSPIFSNYNAPQAPGHTLAQTSPNFSNYNAPQASGHTLAQTSPNFSNYNAPQAPGHTAAYHVAPPFQNNQVTPCNSITSTSDELQSLGEKFATWFYDKLNSQNPSFGRFPQDFGPHHFLEDVVMHLLCMTNAADVRKESFSGSQSVSERLLAFVKGEQILFNPNICREGIITKSTSYGLLLVVVCGTVHRVNQCLGLFDQMFGLIQDPFVENNFKIKLTKLKIQTSQITSLPKLTDKSEAEIQDLLAV